MAHWTYVQTSIAFLLLGAGVANDLRARKVQNQIIVIGMTACLLYVGLSQGLAGLFVACISFLTALVAILPLYILRILGGGDVKLFLTLSILLSWQEVLVTLLGSILWGSVLGTAQVFLRGDIKAFAHNMMALAQRVKPPEQKVHKIPYTVALLFGYLTSMVWLGVR